jgi:hypothetical protein
MATTPEAEQIKRDLIESIKEEGLDPNMLMKLGDMAEAVLKDKSLYPQFLQAVIDNDLAEEADLSGEIDYQLIGLFITTREIVKEMMTSGELGV